MGGYILPDGQKVQADGYIEHLERELADCKDAGAELHQAICRHRPKEIDRPVHLRDAIRRWEEVSRGKGQS